MDKRRMITERDILFAKEQYDKWFNRCGKDHQKTKMWRSTILRLNNHREAK
jgi:hypothetical protein